MMEIPWWVFRIWAKGNSGTPLPTFKEGKNGRRQPEWSKLENLINDTEDVMPEPASHREAERIVAYAWALYVFADPPVYRLEGKNATKFPLSSFIEVAQGYIVAAFDGIQRAERSSDPAAKAFREAVG
jgi:hypothetical protein